MAYPKQAKSSSAKKNLAIIGGGAAGCFAAIIAAELNPLLSITIYEKSSQLLGKVKISGGGRCNVTHNCTDPEHLVKSYPRGNKELLGPFHRFGPGDMIYWLNQHNVALKTELDGRVFPLSDKSETITQCFIDQLFKNNVIIKKNANIYAISYQEGNWLVRGELITEAYDYILITTGGSPAIWNMLSTLGLAVVPPVPSLFTFDIQDARIKGLQGISLPKAHISISDTKHSATGPLLITHRGLSGPAILSLSARAARELHAIDYHFNIEINYSGRPIKDIYTDLLTAKHNAPKKKINTAPNPLYLPARLWDSLCTSAGINEHLSWGNISDKTLQELSFQVAAGIYEVNGKNTFKEEFVTAGGVSLKEINFKTMEAKRFPGLYFAGEVLDIDALTGGYNFQAAWTTAWIAARSLSGTT